MKDNFVLYESVVGSTAYNLTTPTSDRDIRRVVTPTSMTYFFGLDKFYVGNVITTKELDNTDYSVQKFCDLLIKNTVMLEMLFVPSQFQAYVHPLFKKYFINNRYKFLSKNLYHVVKGYANAEYKRALGETTGTLGVKRKEDLKEFKYSPKNASHCIRLLLAAKNALLYSEFTVYWEGDMKNLLMELKTGKISLDKFKDMFECTMVAFEAAKIKSNLPEKTNYSFFNTLLTNFYLELFNIKYSDMNI